MKTTTNSNWNNGVVYKIDMRNEATAAFKTVLLLERAYAPTYIARILKGDDRFDLRKDTHSELETFGEFKEMSYAKLEKLITHLIKTGYLQVRDLRYGTITVSDKAVSFMKGNQPLEIDIQHLKNSWYEVQLRIQLRELRKQLSLSENVAAHNIFTNFTMQQIVERKPTTIMEVRSMPGCKHLSDDEASSISKIILDMQKKIERDNIDGTFRRVYSPPHRETKRLYNEGKSIGEIAETIDAKPRKIKEYLSHLHQAGELDLTEWIENQLEPKELHRGTEYFKQASSPLLKEAHEVLGMDYEKLQMCRAYATRAQEEQAEYLVA